MIARTKLLTFIISFFIIFFFSVALVGEHGYLHNRSMRAYLSQLDSEIERREAIIEALRSQSGKNERIRVLEKHEVEVISISENNSADRELIAEEEKVTIFNGLSSTRIALISLFLSLFITIFSSLITKRRVK